jgi:hypothetical protein
MMMPNVHQNHGPQLPGSLTLEQASTLLRLGRPTPSPLICDLIERLRQPDGFDWLNAAIRNSLLDSQGSPEAFFLHKGATLEQLNSIKQRSKELVQEPDQEARRAGLAGYYLSIAAALRYYGAMLTSRGRHELNDILLDLAEAAPQPFDRLLSEAALVETTE